MRVIFRSAPRRRRPRRSPRHRILPHCEHRRLYFLHRHWGARHRPLELCPPPFPEDRLQITGLHGRLEVSLFGDKPTALRYRIIVDTLTTATPAHIQAPLSRTVVNALLGRGECPSTGASARRTLRVVAQFLAAYCGVREDDFWTCSTTWPATTSTS